MLWGWTVSIFLFGVVLWQRADSVGPAARGGAVATMAGALLLFMMTVADDLFPRTPIVLRNILKSIAGVALLVGLLWTVWASGVA